MHNRKFMTSCSAFSISTVPRRKNLITTSCPVSSSLHSKTSGPPSTVLPLPLPPLHRSSFSFLYLHTSEHTSAHEQNRLCYLQNAHHNMLRSGRLKRCAVLYMGF